MDNKNMDKENADDTAEVNAVSRRRHSTIELIKKMVTLAIFVALAFACEFVLHIKVSFLTFDAKDAVITIGAMFYGPVAGICMSLIISLLEMVTVSDTGIWGFIMNFVSTAVFAALASFIYRKMRNMTGAVIGLVASVIGMTGVMMLMNLFITPIYMGCDRSTVVSLIPSLLLPFNLVKAVLNASLVLVLYKPIVTALRAAHLIADGGKGMKMTKTSVIVLVIGIILIVASVVIFMTVLNGQFDWIK